MNELVLALCEFYHSDPTAPSVVVSYLQEKKVYYVSLSRYHGPFASGREIVVKVTHEKMEAAIFKAAEEFLTLIGRGPKVNNLVEMINVI